jgi:dCTP deaminase
VPVLTHDQINKELKLGNIQFSPPIKDDQISVASVDLHLSNEFRIFQNIIEIVDLKEETDYKDLTELITAEELILKPHETVLGITKEQITLPSNICGWLEGRSRFARLGLLIHISAGFIQPGVSNRQVLEITNLSPNSLVLHANERLCQIVFQRCEGNAKYNGKFVEQ